MPSFDIGFGYEVYEIQRDKQTNYVGVKCPWNGRHDAPRLVHSEMTLDELQSQGSPAGHLKVTLPVDTGSKLVKELEALRVPAAPGTYQVGCDGTTYELVIGGWFAGATFRWWEEAPECWSSLGTFAKHVVRWIDHAGQKSG